MSYDICIIGGGPGGYTAAIKGAQLGAKVALVEKESLGGTCLNHGCIPTKNLYSASELIRGISEGEKFGIKSRGTDIDLSLMMERKNEVVSHLRKGLQKLFNDHKINLFEGKGAIESAGKVRVDSPNTTEMIEASNIIIATGSEAADIPPLRIDGRTVLGNRDILQLEKIPDSLVIVGGGPIGCEFANIFERLGTKITIIEVLDRLLPYCEKEISRIIRKRFEERGMNIITGKAVASTETSGNAVTVVLDDGEEVRAGKVLMAVGRRLNSFGLNLEDLHIEMEGNAVKVNDRMETSFPGVYAIGDVTGKMALAHVAAHEGKVAASNAMGVDALMNYSTIPWAIYIHPEIATVGKGEEALKGEGISYNVGRFPYLANGKAVSMREEDGFVKVLVSKEDDRVLGVHILGAHASDLIAEAALAMQMGCTVKDISNTIHTHPTLAEALQEGFEDSHGMAIHKAGRRKI